MYLVDQDGHKTPIPEEMIKGDFRHYNLSTFYALQDCSTVRKIYILRAYDTLDRVDEDGNRYQFVAEKKVYDYPTKEMLLWFLADNNCFYHGHVEVTEGWEWCERD